MDWKTPAGVLILPFIACIVWIVLANQPKVVSVTFSAEGNLIKNNPGLDPNEWYLVYEKPGEPGITIKILFDRKSRCIRNSSESQCDMSFEQGERATIRGELLEGKVLVHTLYFH